MYEFLWKTTGFSGLRFFIGMFLFHVNKNAQVHIGTTPCVLQRPTEIIKKKKNHKITVE